MSLPNMFPGQKSYCIVVGGDINDPDQQKLSLLKVHDPLRHSSDITPDQLPHVGIERSATQTQLEQFCAPPEQGTTVVTTFNLGDPTSRVIVGMPTELNSAENIEGNSGRYDILKLVSQKKSGKRIKPEIIERMVNGVLVRVMKEKNQDWMHNLTKGIATHAAWNPMVGQLLKEVKSIETALQGFANIPNAGDLAQLPGSIMNIASILKGLSKKQRKQATKNMSSNLIEGLDNMILLMSDTSTSGSNYVSSDRINPEVYTQNMIDLLSQVDNIGDLIDVFDRLNYDETLRGLDHYAQQAYSGLKANSTINIVTDDDPIEETSELILNDIVDQSIHFFDEGYSLNVASHTYVVVSADPSSNTVTVYPKIEHSFTNQPVNVYLPILEYQTEGPYGPMTMTMDMNGNVSPNKDTAQKVQKAMQALQGLMGGTQAGKDFLFGDAAGIMSNLFNRIPNNIRATVLSNIGQGMSDGPNQAHKRLLMGLLPH